MLDLSFRETIIIVIRDIISEREEELPVLTIGKILKIASEDKSVVSLGPGEPDFDAPQNVIDACKRALDEKRTHYSPVEGKKELLEMLLEKVKRENKIKVKPENMMVTVGCTEGIFMGLMATVDPGDGVLVPNPGFLSFTPTVELLSGFPIPVPLLEDNDFQYDVDELRDITVADKTKAMIINTPSNPVGNVLSRKTLEEIADFAVEYDIFIVADETYERLIYDDAKHVSIGSFNGMEDRVLSLYSFSKSYAMPGFRLGYAAGPENVISAMRKIHIMTTLCAPTMSQMAGVEALRNCEKDVERMRLEYDKRRKYIIKRLSEIEGVKTRTPQGAFYAFPNVKGFGHKSLNIASHLLKEGKVAVIPGTEFGSLGEGYIRLSYATSMKNIEEGMNRLERGLNKLRIKGHKIK